MENEQPPQEDEVESNDQVEFDRQKWEAIKNNERADTFQKLKQGKEMGVPQEELEQIVQDEAGHWQRKKNYGFEYWIRKRLDMGSPEELSEIGERSYIAYVAEEDFKPALDIALDIYGPDSSEYKYLAEKLKIKEIAEKEEYDAPLAQIYEHATLASLMTEWEKLKKFGRPHSDFEIELNANFGTNVLQDFREIVKAGKTGEITVIEFFARYGESKENIEAILNIEFLKTLIVKP